MQGAVNKLQEQGFRVPKSRMPFGDTAVNDDFETRDERSFRDLLTVPKLPGNSRNIHLSSDCFHNLNIKIWT